jgi:hypothetical protein
MYIMEIIEGIVWIMMGFTSTLLTMEVAWRLARRQAKSTFVNKTIV